MPNPEINFFHSESEVTSEKVTFPAITKEQLADTEKRVLPYNSVIEVFNSNKEAAYQALEAADPEGSSLRDYRLKARDDVKSALGHCSVVAIVGPSRSAKTEAIIVSRQPAFDRQESLAAQLNGLPMLYHQEIDTVEQAIDVIQERINEAPKKNKMLLIDEFIPNERGAQVLQHFIKDDYKIIVCYGGRLSNQDKVKAVNNLAQYAPELGSSECIEVSVKPFAPSQMQEIFERFAESYTIEPTPEMQRALETVKQVSVTFPIQYHLAEDIVKSLVSGNGVYNDLTFSDSRERWEEVLKSHTIDPEFANRYGHIRGMNEVIKV